jgi:hypothetical protein
VAAIPYQRVEVRTPLPLAEVQRRIALLVGPRRSFAATFGPRPAPDRPFDAVLLTLGGFYPEAFEAERIIRAALEGKP